MIEPKEDLGDADALAPWEEEPEGAADFFARIWWTYGPGRVYVWWKSRVTP